MNGGILTKDDARCVRPFPRQDDGFQERLHDPIRQEEKRRHLIRVLQRPTPPWDPADHPEIEDAGGAAPWVKQLRREAEQGFEKRTRAKQRE
jgi:hypothetical protein